jgi:uncharacterized protein (TIGR02246 family)
VKTDASRPHDPASQDEREVCSLYRSLLDCWNRRDAADFASKFAADCNLVGFDGSQIDGRAEIGAVLGKIFADHPTAAYVSKVRGVRFIGAGVAVLRAVVGMVPPGKTDLNPAVHAVQTLIAAKHDGRWQIEVFQNTPAAFHGRPELVEKLTEELREVLHGSSGDPENRNVS